MQPTWRRVRLPFTQLHAKHLENSLLVWLADLGVLTASQQLRGFAGIMKGYGHCDVLIALASKTRAKPHSSISMPVTPQQCQDRVLQCAPPSQIAPESSCQAR